MEATWENAITASIAEGAGERLRLPCMCIDARSVVLRMSMVQGFAPGAASLCCLTQGGCSVTLREEQTGVDQRFVWAALAKRAGLSVFC